MVYIGAENIISPLGDTAQENFEALTKGQTGLKLIPGGGIKDEDLYLSVINKIDGLDTIKAVEKSIQDSLSQVHQNELGRTELIISTTKGEINLLKNGDVQHATLDEYKRRISESLPWVKNTTLVSNACISGVLALIVGHDLISTNQVDSVIVTGVDMVSEFTIAGFQAFFAMSDGLCKPFDKNRDGINLGEGVATIIMSKNKAAFKSTPLQSLGGSAANDANHISGPSRTGEGLYRSMKNTLKNAQVNSNEIDFISAHGTATAYNDEMESIAFDRMDLCEVPLHSLKGYYGHTFGAAGMIESVICLQSMRANKLIACIGFEENGTSKPLNIIKQTTDKNLNTVLKTASGFGGCNASILFKK